MPLKAFSTPFCCMHYYSQINKGYDSLHSGEQLEKAALIKENCALKGLLLDIGAGTGLCTREFEKQAVCIALDPAKEMLLHFPGPKVVGRAEQLPFKNSSFDSVVSITALHHSNLVQAKAEIARIAKPGAKIAISFFKRAASFQEAKRLFSNLKQIDSEKDLIFAKT